MPYKDPDKQREYQRKWVARRRQEFLSDEVCKQCGCSDNLEIHHRDPDRKKSHRIWAWSKSRIQQELDKCDILCTECHRQESAEYCRELFSGANSPNSKFTEPEVRRIRKQYALGVFSTVELAEQHDVSKSTIARMIRNESYANVS